MRTPVYSLAALAALAALVVGVLGCDRDKPAPPQVTVSATGGPPPAHVELFVNGSPVGKVQIDPKGGWPRLDTLVPPDARKLGTWELVSLYGVSPKPTEVASPSTSYPDMVPAIFPSAGGGVSFGMFDPVELARKGKPAMRQDNVVMIKLKVAQSGSRGQNDDGHGAAADPSKLALTIKSAAGTTTLSGDKLLALPREPMPGNAEQKGWRLTAFLTAAGVTSYERLILTDASGTSLNLDKSDVSETSVPFVKLNKQGALRLRVLKKTGEGWNPGGDLRALVTIDAK